MKWIGGHVLRMPERVAKKIYETGIARKKRIERPSTVVQSMTIANDRVNWRKIYVTGS